MTSAGAGTARDVFCNFPFDGKYESLYLALVAALLCTGQTPRTILEIPPGVDRLSRLLTLIGSCHYSLHDLSRVQLSVGRFKVPRFNMPFELGLAVALAHGRKGAHQFRLLEERRFRLQHSLSDLNGYDPYIHHATTSGMFGAICDVFTQFRPFPISEPRGFQKVYRGMRAFRMHQFSRKTVYTSDRFAQLVVAGREYVRSFSNQHV